MLGSTREPLERLYTRHDQHRRQVRKNNDMERSQTCRLAHQKTYKTGVRIRKLAMTEVERKLERRDGIEPWFIDITDIEQASR